MAVTVAGLRSWSGQRTKEGHREYTLKQLVYTNDADDGPQTVFTASGLPVPGSQWSYGNDFDAWAFCTPQREIRIHKEKAGDPAYWYEVTSHFTSDIDLERCNETEVEDPLLEPQKISGSFVKYTKEADTDKDGNLLLTSSLEKIRGKKVEFDANRPTVKIEQNVSLLELDVFSSMVDTVNNAALWGLPARCVKLSNVSWERRYYGVCDCYYTRVLDFDVSYNTFDRYVYDEGTKVLKGKWDRTKGSPTYGTWVVDSGLDRTNPQDFVRYEDWKGNPVRTLLDGLGRPANAIIAGVGTGTAGDPAQILIQHYTESNLLLLGIPTNLTAC